MKEEKTEYKNPQRSSFWWALIMGCFLLAFAYFGDGLVVLAQRLDEGAAYPVWSWCLWGFVIIALWVFIIGPVIHFCNLRYVGEESLRRQVKRICSLVSGYSNEPEDSDLRQLADEFKAAPVDYNSVEGKNGWQELLARFREAVQGRAKEAIIGYSKAAGVAMVLSLYGLLDGLLLLAIELRLCLVLARTFGYKTSALFNGYFAGWIVVNSLVVALTAGLLQQLGGSVVDSMLAGADESSMAQIRKILAYGIAALIQAVAAGLLTYATGRVFLRRLVVEGREKTLQVLLKLRAEGRLKYELEQMLRDAAAKGLPGGEAPAALPHAAAGLTRKVLKELGPTKEEQPAAALPVEEKAAEKAPAILPEPQAKVAEPAAALPAKPAEPVPATASPAPADEGKDAISAG